VTKDGYRTLVNSLNSFHPGLRMGDITHDIIMRWQHWMRSERKLSENTIAVRLKALRCLVNEAVKRKVIRADNDPFLQIRIPEIKARREHLTEEELRAMETVTLTDKRQKHLRDAFLFCCYTGLRWGDFHRLTSNNLHQHTLSFEQHKTGGHVELPLDVLWTARRST
jgi:integrase